MAPLRLAGGPKVDWADKSVPNWRQEQGEGGLGMQGQCGLRRGRNVIRRQPTSTGKAWCACGRKGGDARGAAGCPSSPPLPAHHAHMEMMGGSMPWRMLLSSLAPAESWSQYHPQYRSLVSAARHGGGRAAALTRAGHQRLHRTQAVPDKPSQAWRTWRAAAHGGGQVGQCACDHTDGAAGRQGGAAAMCGPRGGGCRAPAQAQEPPRMPCSVCCMQPAARDASAASALTTASAR